MTPAAIRTGALSKDYGAVHALRDLNLEIAQGEVFGYLGPNGAGKTTTIRLLLGLARPTAGRAEIFGLDCQRQAVEAHRRLAYVAGEANLWPSLTGTETLHLLGRVQGRVDTGYRDELIARFDLDPGKKVRAYSKGNRQKLMLVAALMTRAPLLLLDEPTNGLDPLMEQAFRRSIHEARENGQTVFLSSHILSEVEALCDRVGILRQGVLVRPVSRSSWLAGRVALAAAAVVAGGLLAGFLAWAGAASQGTGVPLPSMLGAGASMAAPGLCVLGIGVLAVGVWPRAAAAVSYGVLAWSLLIELAGGFFGSSHWLLDTSVFHHLAAAPAVSPNWASAAGLVAVGAAAAVLGGLAFTRRDLAGE
jgi:ABC-type multidrug transport system ATPase subunit